MKLRNKKTGEIGKLHCDMQVKPMKIGVFEDTDIRGHYWEYNSLAELIEEWEDYEEPKEANEIDVVLDAIDEYCNEHSYYSGDLEKIKILNNVEEKLKAWKRLKDKGFINEQVFSMNLNWCNPDDDDWKAFKLLFGGEDE